METSGASAIAVTTGRIPVSVIPSMEETPLQAVARQLELYKAINTLIDMTFVEGEDYNIIPGTDTPSLLIPGIEKASGLLGLRPEFHDIEVVRDYTPGAPFFYYEVECVMFSIATGQRVATGQGVCHTREKSYMRQQRKCPICGTEAVRRSRNQGEGWYCWKKENGCGATFLSTDPLIVKQEVGNVQDPQLVWDGINKARKVANKRASSSAIRQVAMLSGHIINRKANASGTAIRYTPAEIKEIVALARRTENAAIIATAPAAPVTPTAPRAAELMGSGGKRRVDTSEATVNTSAPTAPAPESTPTIVTRPTPPHWSDFEGNRNTILNRAIENLYLDIGDTWADLLILAGQSELSVKKIATGAELGRLVKEGATAKYRAAHPADEPVDVPEPTIATIQTGYRTARLTEAVYEPTSNEIVFKVPEGDMTVAHRVFTDLLCVNDNGRRQATVMRLDKWNTGSLFSGSHSFPEIIVDYSLVIADPNQITLVRVVPGTEWMEAEPMPAPAKTNIGRTLDTYYPSAEEQRIAQQDLELDADYATSLSKDD